MFTLKKLQFKPGINKEKTRYASELNWYDGDKVRFREGYPESIGGWQSVSSETFLGICRSIMTWTTLSAVTLRGLGTHLKFYIENGGQYYDITPLRDTQSLTDPFSTTVGSSTVQVTDAAAGFKDGDFVTFSGADAVGGLTLDGEHQITLLTASTYTVEADSAATSTATGGGSVSAAYQINVGNETAVPLSGWGSGAWGAGAWGYGGEPSSLEALRLWSQSNFGEDLIFCYTNGPAYYWDSSTGTGVRAVRLDSMVGASDVPTTQIGIFVSDVSRFVFAFGCNELGSSDQDPLLVRWSDQEDAWNWTPAATNQAGGIRLSRGSRIRAWIQSRQEILVWTDSALYSFQYVSADITWAPQLVGENITIASRNSVAYSNGAAYWMGIRRFYVYDGRAQPLDCDLEKYIFSDFNFNQFGQVFAGTNESFHEVWWFYCSANSNQVDRYVVFNYLENVWYHGTLSRTAWQDSYSDGYPVATSYNGKLLRHEYGVDDVEDTTPQPIHSYIESGEFDIDDGYRFAFIRKVMPDVTFEGSVADLPSVDLTLYALKGSGAGRKSPTSESGESSGNVVRSVAAPVEQFTDHIYVRVRGRQMVYRMESNSLGVAWQSGDSRIEVRTDGRA